MKKISITTALVSLLAFYGADGYSAEVTSKSMKEQSKSSKVVTKSGDTTKKVTSEKTTQSSTTNVAGKKEADVKHVAIKPVKHESHNKASRIAVHGEIKSVVHMSMPEEGYKVAPGGDGKANGLKGNTGDYREDWGAYSDAVLGIRAENKNPDLGITYGAQAELELVGVEGKIIDPKSARNRGTKVFVDTGFGEFSFGPQAGAEETMRLDPSSFAAGDSSNSWTKYVHLEGLTGTRPFYLAPGLYSETLFNESNSLSATLTAQGKNFSNTLPVRLNYTSTSLMGARVGVSYAPTGYKDELFLTGGAPAAPGTISGTVDIPAQTISGVSVPAAGLISAADGSPVTGSATAAAITVPKQDAVPLTITTGGTATPATGAQYLGPKYNHIVSAGVHYDYDFDEFKIKAGLTGEYAKAVSASDLKVKYAKYLEVNDLAGVSVGATVDWKGAKVGGSYGYLGKSGVTKGLYKLNTTTNAYELDGALIPEDQQKSTYYWNVGVGYEYAGVYGSVSYFNSDRNEGDKFSDISVGVEYNLASGGNRSKNQFKVFGQYHYFTTEEKLTGARPADAPANDNKGSVALAGVKFTF